MFSLFLLFLFCFFPVFVLSLTVSTASGPIAGGSCEGPGSGSGVNYWLGIPFAAPPVGENRFSSPQPVSPWAETLQATAFASACPQVSGTIQLPMPTFSCDAPGSPQPPLPTEPVIGSEDCLYLNVFSPMAGAGDSLKAVLIFLYGGALSFGFSDNRYSGVSYAAQQDLVIVTLNYRVGALGFLPLANENSLVNRTFYGNLGLQDQLMAFNWVRENIQQFGGDPDKITIGGQSAGGSAALAHFVSPASAGLFSAVLVESGSPLLASAFIPLASAVKAGEDFIDKRNCSSGSQAEVLKCLRALPVNSLVLNELSQPDMSVSFLTIDGEFLSDTPMALIAQRQQPNSSIPLLIGNNWNETTLLLQPVLRALNFTATPLTFQSIPLVFSVFAQWLSLPVALQESFWSLINPVYEPFQSSLSPMELLSFLATDYWMRCGLWQLGHFIENPYFLYEFRYAGSPSIPLYQRLGDYHSIELYFVWNTTEFTQKDKGDQEMATIIQDYWGEFVRKNPQQTIQAENRPLWNKFQTNMGNRMILEGNLHSDSSDNDPLVQRCQMWEIIFQKLASPSLEDFISK